MCACSSGRGENLADFVNLTSAFTTAVFTCEAVLKIVSEGFEPARYFTDPELGGFNTFDFAIVSAGYVLMALESKDGSAIGALRMLRLIRLFTFVKGIPQLRAIISGFARVSKLYDSVDSPLKTPVDLLLGLTVVHTLAV